MSFTDRERPVHYSTPSGKYMICGDGGYGSVLAEATDPISALDTAMLAEGLKPAEGHQYISTACQHGKHEECRQRCKFCDVACGCDCGHTAVVKQSLTTEQDKVTMAELRRIFADKASAYGRSDNYEQGIRAVLDFYRGKVLVD